MTSRPGAAPESVSRPQAWPASEAARLRDLLRARIRGEVRFDAASRGLYATDASNYRQVPIGVVIPHTVDDVVETVAVARSLQAPVLLRGGGTSLAGQTCNVALVLDTSKYLDRVLSIDPGQRLARVEPGVVCDVLRHAAEAHGLTFGPDPSTHSRCTLGGMIGNNSCGAHSVMAGKTVNNIEALEVLTYDGTRLTVGPTSDAELARLIGAGGRVGGLYAGLKAIRERYGDAIRREFPDIRRRVSGYNLDALLPENGCNVAQALVGTEGTCAITLGATARLVASPPVRVLLVLGFDDICTAGDHAPGLMPFGPLCIEGLDEHIIGDMRKKGLELDAIRLLPAGNAWLMVEFGGTSRDEAEAQATAAASTLAAASSGAQLYTEPRDQRTVWSIRESGAAATNAVPGEPETYPGWEDAAVDPARVGDYLRDFRTLLGKFGYKSSLYGHFGDGCIHGRITFDLHSRDGLKTWRRFMEAAADLVVRYGGSLSGEHGDGQARAELLPRMFSPTIMQAFAEFKRLWDPDNKLNPGKLIDPARFDQDLRTGPDYTPLQPATVFRFPRDQGSFASAAGRCVGTAKCRRIEGGVMCPSYRATREEAYSTRGRARLLFELVQGDPVDDLWDNETVKDSLDLCLACKGCRHECPVQVDMATYKAEFMAHYYQHHRRPRQAWTIGRFHEWARLAGAAPRLVNAALGLPGVSGLAKRLAGVAPARALPRFSARPFTRSYRSAPSGDDRPAVVLWPDTFNNFLHAAALSQARQVLEALGFAVLLPGRPVCCGRPLYDFGFANRVRQRLAHALDTLQFAVERELPVIGLEPACLGSFRDELLSLFPDDTRARWLAQNSWLLADFLVTQDELELPQLSGRALIHGHCHQKALFGMQGSRTLLQRLGLEVELLDAGCCGMAGAFGFDPARYEVSQRIGEETLLPAVRAATADTLIVADGYSCREQIVQATGRQPLHTADVLGRALNGG